MARRERRHLPTCQLEANGELVRVARHFVSDLQHPALMPLHMWAKSQAPAIFLEAHK